MDLNLSRIDPRDIGFAKSVWAEGDILRVMVYVPSWERLNFLIDNLSALKKCDVYEEALLDVYTGTHSNSSGWSFSLVNFLFHLADRKKLLKCGEPLPGDGPFTIYRGVSGRGVARRIRGISWTGSIERAIWFAKRFNLEKPAVFRAKVKKSLVYVYSNDRSEAEFLCKIPPDLKLEKVWQGGEKDEKGQLHNNFRPQA